MTAAPPSEPSHLRILLVEDSGLQAKALVKLLLELGYPQVEACPNAAFAYELLKDSQFDLVLCDWQMPKISGLEFLKQLRATPDFSSIPFFFLTAQGEKERVVEALRSGAQDFIVKPVSPEVLRDKLALFEEEHAKMPR